MSRWDDAITTLLSEITPSVGEWSGAFGCIVTKIESMVQYLQVVSTSLAGLCPKLPGNIHFYLRGDGTWAAPPGTGGIGGTTGSSDGEILVAAGTEGDTVRGSGITVETTLTDDDTKIPTSGAVHDAIAAIPTGGDVSGPSSATDGNLAVFDGPGGKKVKDGGLPLNGISTSPTDNSIPRFDSTGGKTIQKSGVTIDDSDNICTFRGIQLDPSALANLAVQGVTIKRTAAASTTRFQAGYTNSSGKIALADSDAASTMPAALLAAADISADAVGEYLKFGIARNDSWNWTVGGQIYANGTPGALSQTAPSGTTGMVVQIVGKALSATIILWDPCPLTIELA